jgi:hypothetical protein
LLECDANRSGHACREHPAGVLAGIADALGDHGGEEMLHPGGGIDERVAERGTGGEEQQHIAIVGTWVGALLHDRLN